MKTNSKLLGDLKDQMLSDSRLSRSSLAQSAKQLVFGWGNPQAEIVFVGEAPGRQEDLAGRPFVGAAGKFLQQCLASCQLNLKDVWLTNLVKYRPPHNRDPYPLEKKLHAPYLRRELALIKPRLIVTLGVHAGTYFVKKFNLAGMHGRISGSYVDSQRQVEAQVATFYHPAAALYNPQLKQVILEDFSQVFKQYGQKNK